MNKAVLVEAIGMVKNLRPGEPCPLNPESAGVLRAFLQARAGVPQLSESEKALHSRIAQVLRDWSATPSTEAAAGSADHRTQLALRRVIDLIRKNRWQDISTDDVQLIRASHKSLIDRYHETGEEPTRLVRLMQTMLAKYDWFHSRNNPPAGGNGATTSVFTETAEAIDTEAPEPPTEVRNRIVPSRDFGDKKRVQKTVLDEIEVDIHGRVFEYTGETAIDGDLPGDVLLIVKNGGVTLNGFVAGSVLADQSVVIHGNTQGGIVISREGDIAVERILVGSRIVARKGSVRCQHVEAPKCVFAWDSVEIDGPVLGGFLAANAVKIDGKISPGEIHSCGEITATSLEAGARRGAVICLRPMLTCEDFGRLLEPDEERKLRRLTQLEDDRARALSMDSFTNRLIENTYRTALFYLLGGAENAQNAMDLQGLQAKAMHLSQLVLLGESIDHYYSAAYTEESDPDPFEITDFKNTSLRSLAIIQRDVEAMPSEYGSVNRRFLLDRCGEMEAMIEALDEQDSAEGVAKYMNDRVRRVLSQWRAALGDAERGARGIIAGFGLADDVLKELDGDADTLEALLDRTVAEKLASRIAESMQRAKSPLVRILKDSAARFERSIQQNRRLAASAKEEIGTIRGKLEEDAIVRFGPARKFACRVTADAYAPGVVLTATPGKDEGFHANMGEVIVFDSTVEGPATFALGDGIIQRISS